MSILEIKLAFIQKIVSLENEQLFERLEALLDNKKEEYTFNELKPFTVEELQTRISKSEKDFKEGRLKTTEELLMKYRLKL